MNQQAPYQLFVCAYSIVIGWKNLSLNERSTTVLNREDSNCIWNNFNEINTALGKFTTK